MNDVLARISTQDFAQAFLDADLAAVHGRGQVAVRQRLQQVSVRLIELHSEFPDPALLRLHQSSRVMRDELADDWVCTDYIPEVPGSIKRMKAGRTYP
ncbi:hypothetical protein OHA18_41355 [Kribbella sp. NBC_00709]|nr:hypothetical protein [Kribbella sp. NBC_00709]